jgi:hypothetical protein
VGLRCRLEGGPRVDEALALDGFEGRIGNGSCTVCHTALTAFDSDAVAPKEVGYVRFRFEQPEGVDTPFPVFLGLDGPEPEERPAGLNVGPLRIRDRMTTDDGISTTVLALEPGRWFVVGQLDGGTTAPEISQSTYMPNSIGAPRFLDVEAGRITDVTDSPALRWAPE